MTTQQLPPLVIPIHTNTIIYAGYVNMNNNQQPILMVQNNNNNEEEEEENPSTFTLYSTPITLQNNTSIQRVNNIKNMLSSPQSILDTWLNELNNSSIKQEVQQSFNHSSSLATSASICKRIIQDLVRVEHQHTILHLNESFDSVQIQIRDVVGRKHDLKISIDVKTGYPISNIPLICNLPNNTMFKLSPPYPTHIYEVVDIFNEEINKFQHLWNELDEMDTTFMITDPILPASRAITYRRIALKNNQSITNCFLHIQLPSLQSGSGSSSSSIPSIDCIGPEKDVAPIRELLEILIREWKLTISVCENLLLHLGQILVLKQKKNQQVTSSSSSNGIDSGEQNLVQASVVECGVCYSYRLIVDTTTNGNNEDYQLPDTLCEHCRRPFHQVCLSEWLRSIPSCSKRTFQQLVGECPYCGNSISCAV
jgi:E3 ubiquitin-protein ligase FANCL